MVKQQRVCEIRKRKYRNIFRTTMSLDSFYMISRIILMINQQKKKEENRLTNLQLLEIFGKNMKILAKLYYPAENIDEQLVAFRGCYHFKQYIPRTSKIWN